MDSDTKIAFEIHTRPKSNSMVFDNEVFKKGRTYIHYHRCGSSGTLAKNPTRGHLIKRVNEVNFCREKSVRA